MADYKQIYFHLFNRCTDAIALIEKGQNVLAARTLKSAQRECEEMCICNGKLIYFHFNK